MGAGFGFAFANQIFRFLLRPAGDIKLVFTQPTEMMGTYFNLSLTAGLAAATPVILMQVVKFVAPALFPREKVYLYSLLPAALLAFLAGAAFTYLVLLPPAMKFLLTFGSDIAEPFIRIGSYISLVTRLIFWMGVVFEMPVVVFILARLGLITSKALTKHWRLAMLAAFVIAGIITPTVDPVNQTLVAAPLILLYGLSIVLASVAQAGRRKRALEMQQAEAR